MDVPDALCNTFVSLLVELRAANSVVAGGVATAVYCTVFEGLGALQAKTRQPYVMRFSRV